MWAQLLNLQFIRGYSFGIFAVVAFLLGSFIFWKKSREEHFDDYLIVDTVLILMLWGLIGARVAYIGMHFNDFGLNILYWFSIWSKPGLYWVGLFITGLIFLYRFCIVHKWDFYKIVDLAAIGAALAQALLNLGIFLSASAMGKTTTLPVGVMFPGSFEKRHPIGLYAFIYWLIIFAFLWWLEKKYRRFIWYQKSKGDAWPGLIGFAYVAFLGLIGIILLPISEANYIYFNINIDVLIRVLLVIIGVVGIILRSGLTNKITSLSTISKKTK